MSDWQLERDGGELHPSEHLSVHPSPGDEEWGEARWSSGIEPPWDSERTAAMRTVVRTFCFVDLCRSTAFLETHGSIQATRVVGEFRNLARAITARRGVRVAKWLGDGAMLVGVSAGPVIATAAELVDRWDPTDLAIRAGVSVSWALLLDGDDYLARGANFAARICDVAEPGEVLCDLDCLEAAPAWIRPLDTRTISVRGMGDHQVVRLAVTDRAG